jgi:hypothetical protein
VQDLPARSAASQDLRDRVEPERCVPGANVAIQDLMEPSQARTRLLAEHDQLREVLARAERIAADALSGVAAPGQLHEILQLCRDLFAAHNASEELVLAPILLRDLAWGQARVDRMFDEHRAEHAEIRAALTGSDLVVAKRVAELRELVEAHMAAEERTFLSRGVLRDDPVSIEGSS